MFKEVKKNFGFGLMRLPMIEKEVDIEQTKKMVDIFMGNGFTYFDTAHGYISGKSELAFRECVAKRYDRSSYTITDKLTENYFNSKDDIYKVFNEQLASCGVSYFDFYLMHAQGKKNYDKFKKYDAYEVALELKKQGKINHVGISFHDSAEFLDKILTEKPFVELVQIQLNYIDYLDDGIQSKKCLDVCIKHNKPVVIMEPIKGGKLVNLPSEANKIFKDLNRGSNASYALRFAASQKNVIMVLSGMSNISQMEDNISFMKDFKPLDDFEYKAIDNVCEILRKEHAIPCTSCKYCVDGCPKKILIPYLFSDYNAKKIYNDWNADYYYQAVHSKENGKASDCIKCGKCENVCPQHLEIRKLLVDVANTFEKK